MALYIMHGSFAQHAKQAQQGLAYLVVLFIAVALGLASTIAYENYSTIAKREREAQWLFAGKQYQQAISSYYHQSPNGFKSLPTKLDDLIKDSRFVSVKRHLRQLYVDPITQEAWQLVLNENQQIIGVVSASQEPILQAAKIAQMLPNAEGTTNYAEFKFIFEPKASATKQSDEVQNADLENFPQMESSDLGLSEDSQQSDDAVNNSSEF